MRVAVFSPNIWCYQCGCLGHLAGTCTKATFIEGTALAPSECWRQLLLPDSDKAANEEQNPVEEAATDFVFVNMYHTHDNNHVTQLISRSVGQIMS